jgi:hypothetical protein
MSTLAIGTNGAPALHTETVPNANGQPLKYEEPRQLTGAIYALGTDSRKLMFKFRREATRSGDQLNVQRDFTYPDGKLAAQEHVVYIGDRLVLYELKELQIGASGGARIRRHADNAAKGSIEFTYSTEAGHPSRVRTEVLADNTLIADMVGPFLASHWEAIRRGEKIKCRYIVVPRTETVGFTFLKDPASGPQDGRALRVRMEATSPFVAALVDPLFFTIEQAPPHRVLQYAGRTTPKVQVAGKWKDLDAVTVFDWESAR